MSVPAVPEGVPSLLTLAEVATALRLKKGTVKWWLERGREHGGLAFVYNTGQPGSGRRVPSAEVARKAHELGLEPDWEAIMLI